MLDEDISILDSLSEILQRMDGVEYSGAIMEHPLTKKTILRVKTDPSKLKAVEAIKKGIRELETISAEIRKEFEKLQ